MCGFVGFLTAGPLVHSQTAPALLSRMADAIAYRGPDCEGFWHSVSSGIALGHRRLAIVDLSPAGVQPMHSLCGRYVLVFNGEIYNHLDIREALGDLPWRGHSDTESLLAGFSTWGVTDTLTRCNGMFALAVWDKQERTLTLARDRMGEKPLYYGWQGHGPTSCFLFGLIWPPSRHIRLFSADICRKALALYMRHNCVPAPYSIYQGVFKLPPSCLLTVSLAEREPKVVSLLVVFSGCRARCC